MCWTTDRHVGDGSANAAALVVDRPKGWSHLDGTYAIALTSVLANAVVGSNLVFYMNTVLLNPLRERVSSSR